MPVAQKPAEGERKREREDEAAAALHTSMIGGDAATLERCGGDEG
jgi:hypothetical protein